MRANPLKKSIEKIVATTEEKHYSELKQKIAKLIERTNQIETNQSEFVSKANLQHLENSFSKEIEKLREEIKKDIMAHKEALAKTTLETSELKDQIAQLSAAREELKKMRAKDILAQISAIDQKIRWLEAQLEQANLAAIKSKIESLESELAKFKSSAPFIIE
jgi:chromosome segregation ATPase